MTRLAVLGVTVALAACTVPLPVADRTQATQAPGGPGASSQILAGLPVATIPVAPVATQTLPPDAPLPTPFLATVTPVAPTLPALPTLPPPPRSELAPNSIPAATAIMATAIARAASATGTAAALPAQEIQMREMAFTPATLTVKPGTRVIWRNLDRVMHHVQGGEFDSGHLASGHYWAALLERPGRYAFICSLHPTMRADVTVSEDTSRPVHLGS
ncbi:MAG TPA: cupredoxin domain-containing protein [Chloroflexota bacterium]|nr:cupredoxin domain-containing protein [Chloroflexota bacterium]